VVIEIPKISINSIEYSNSDDGPILHVFGRDDHGEARRLDVTGFRPYFFALASSTGLNSLTNDIERDDGTYVSIRGEECVRLYTKRPSDVRNVRDKFGTHLEADILFPIRFAVDRGLKSGVEFPSVYKCDYRELNPVDVNYQTRVCMCDIECSDANGWPDSGNDPIICITCHDSFDQTYTTFVLVKDKEAAIDEIDSNDPADNHCFDPDYHAICVYTDERSLMLGFAAYIRSRDPDVLTGWNYTGFDMPYILGRLAALNIPQEVIGRLPGKSDRIIVKGRQIFDLLSGYKRMHLTQKPSYRLDAIAKDEVGEQKIHFNGKVSELSPSKLIEYNFKDVELCVKINAKDEIVNFHIEIAKYVGCPLDRTLNSMPIIDTYILRKAHGRFVLPSKTVMGPASEEFDGATVFPPKKGLHKNAVVLDLTSLYPMAMMTGNMSPDTKDPNGEIVTPIGIRFRKSPDGMVRSIQAEFFAERKEMKRLRGTFAFGSRDYKLYDMKQNVIKVLMNSYYGVSGNQAFRLYDREIGASVTAVGREILEHNRRLIQEEGYEVILGDSVGGDSKILLYDCHGNISFSGSISDAFDKYSVMGIQKKGEKEYCILRGVYTDTVDTAGKAVLEPVKYIMRHNCGKKMYRVNLTNNWSIDVTEDHSLIGYKRPGPEATPDQCMVEVKPAEIWKVASSLIIKKQSARPETESRCLPREAYELLGYFIGCGSFESKARRCMLAGGNDYQEIIEKIFAPLGFTGWLQWRIKSKEKGDIAFYGRMNDIAHASLQGEGTKKKIPSFIYSESYDNQCSFLRGLFSSDGSCMMRSTGPIVRYCSIDASLCEEIQSLLHMVGISSSIFKDNTPNSYNGVVSGTHSYLLYIKNLEMFAKRIGFIEKRKQSRIANYVARKKKNLNDKDFDISSIQTVKEIEYDDYVYDIEVSGTHKFFANNILVHNTDSCVFPVPDEYGREKTIEIARMLEKKLNDSYPSFAKKCLNADKSYFSVKFEKLYGRFFSGGKKKRYAGLLVWKEGKDVNEVDIVGFEIRRSDSPVITKVAQQLLMESVLNGVDYDKIRGDIREIVKKYHSCDYPLDEIGIPGGIGKALNDYETKDAQVRGAEYANEHLGMNFGKGSKPKRIYIKAVPPGFPKTDVLCFEYGDQVPEGFVVDTDLMLEKTLKKPLERIMESLGWNWNEFDTSMTTLSQWGIG